MSAVLTSAMNDLVWYCSLCAIGYAVGWVCLAAALGISYRRRDR